MIEPYYEQDGITIYNADCDQVLPQLGYVDITVSSPPYNTIAATPASGMMRESINKRLDGYDIHTDDMEEAEYQDWIVRVFGRCLELSRGLVWVNHKTRYRNKQGIHPLHILPFPFYSEIVWSRLVSTTLNARKFAPSHEFIYGFGVPHYWDNRCNTLMSVWSITPERNIDEHPCPFPLPIASRCIVASCPEGGVVLDPFMGSGTTLVAAKLEGRQAVGIEISRDYCDTAIKRLQQKVLF